MLSFGDDFDCLELNSLKGHARLHLPPAWYLNALRGRGDRL